jgi:hypothetical protein
MKLLKAALLFLLAIQPAMAAETPASDQSIRELMEVTRSRQMLDATLAQVDQVMQQSMQQAVAGTELNAEQQKVMADMRGRIVALFKNEMKWETLEPMFVEIYRKSLSQGDVDGMLAFYRTETGQAVINKMPLVMQNTMVAMQARMASMTPKLQELQADAVERMKAASEKK